MSVKNSSKFKFLISSFVLFIGFVFFGFLFLHFFKFDHSPKTHLSQQKQSPLIVGFDPNFPPMGFVDESATICGADVDFMNLVAKQMGREVKFQPIDWDAKELELNSGKIDLIANGLSLTPERMESMSLTKPYMSNGQVVVVKLGSSIKNLNDLKGKQVCVQKGSSGESAFEKSQIFKFVQNYVKLESCVDCLNEVWQEKVDAAVVDESVARYYLQKMDFKSDLNNTKLHILSDKLAFEHYVIAVKRGNIGLKHDIEQAFEKVANSSELKQISQKWFGKSDMFQFSNLALQNDNSNQKLIKSELFKMLLSGFLTTAKIFVVCLMFSLPLGLLICFIRTFKIKLINFLISFYIAIMRGTPLLLQLFFAFYGLPIMFPGLILKNRFLVGAITFVLNYAAYFAEIFRGGLLAISVGQFEAIKVLQIPKFKAAFKIVLPQMMKVCLPSICNETVTLVKDTALIFAIGVVELLTTAKNLVNSTANVSFYFIVALIYFVVCSLLKFIFDLFEKKLHFN